MFKKKKSGFTLMEIIIAIALTVTILGITSSIFITGNKVFSDSDVKSTLQIEAKTIQEKISDFGMKGSGILSINKDSNDEINDMVINSYDANENPYEFKIKKEDSGKKYKDGITKRYNLYLDDQLISSNVKSLRIIENNNSMEVSILLREEKGYSNIDYPINFKITFRNSGITV